VTAFPFSPHPLSAPWHKLPEQNLAAYIDKFFKSVTSTSVCRISQAIKNIYGIHKNMYTKSKHNIKMLQLPQNDDSLSKLANSAGCSGWREERQMFKKISLSITEVSSPPSDASLTGSGTGTLDFPTY